MPSTWEAPNTDYQPAFRKSGNEIEKPDKFAHAKKFLEKIIDGMDYSKGLREKNKDREGIMSIEKKQNEITRIISQLDRGKTVPALAVLEKYSTNVGAEDLAEWRQAIFEICGSNNSENEPNDPDERKKVRQMLSAARKWKNVMADMSADDKKETEPNLIEKEIWELHNMVSKNPQFADELAEQLIELRQIRDTFYAMKFKESNTTEKKEKEYSINN
jgi:hypothetical protein